MSAVGHGLDGTNRATNRRKPESPLWFLQAFVEAIFVHCPVSTPREKLVAVGGPACIHAPRRRAAVRHYPSDRVRLASIPNSQRAVNRGVQECGIGGGW